jgi:predicted aconitase with swiveling domain
VELALIGKPVVSGAAEGAAVVSTQPISFWGGLNPSSGEIIDRRHERSGANVAGKVFVFPHGKGSSTASSVLLECIRIGTAPAAIINNKVAPILALGAIVADELYHRTVPIVVLSSEDFAVIQEGDHVVIDPDGMVRVRQR